MPGSVVMTDEYRACAKLSENGYDHLSVNHGEGEYASLEQPGGQYLEMQYVDINRVCNNAHTTT